MRTSTLQRRVIVNNDIVQLINLTLERQRRHSHAGVLIVIHQSKIVKSRVGRAIVKPTILVVPLRFYKKYEKIIKIKHLNTYD
jgi:hypothetical protein